MTNYMTISRGVTFLGRRSPIGIRSAEVRIANYDAGVEVGAIKYLKKKELMKQHFDGVAYFTEFVNNIVKEVADAYGVVGGTRGFLQSAGLRLARFVAKYANIPEYQLAILVDAEIDRELARGGYSPADREYDTLRTILADIGANLITNRSELVKRYRMAQA